MVDHVAIFTDRRGPGGISFQAQTKMRTRLGANLSVRLESADAAVEETGRLRIQFTTQFTEAFQRQDLFSINVHTMGFQ